MGQAASMASCNWTTAALGEKHAWHASATCCTYEAPQVRGWEGHWQTCHFPPGRPAVLLRLGDLGSAAGAMGTAGLPTCSAKCSLRNTGPRMLQAEQVTSRPVHCQKGILAGCPVAPLIAKLVLPPVIKQFQEAYPRATVDVWVDDISVDFVGNDVQVLRREALNGYEALKDGLEGIGLRLSGSKTGFLTLWVECKQTLSLFRREEQPKVHDLLQDLGLDSSGVAGPMAALQAYLMDMGWEALDLDDWVRAPSGQLNLEHPWPHLQRQLKLEQQLHRARRIQELEHCFPMMHRPDWTTFHKMMRKLKGRKKQLWQHGLRAL